MPIVKVTEKGQITLPVDLRRRLGITKDDYLVVEGRGRVFDAAQSIARQGS
jgi:AbrB family looped-hinge helix DNA binding protein